MARQEPRRPLLTAVDHGVIRSLGDFLMLDIIDWDRCRPYTDVQRTMRSIASFLINQYTYLVVDVDITIYPDRDDFPGWRHVGEHEMIGRWFWNRFHHEFEGTLLFSDGPDFSGTILRNGRECPFLGDVGKVSPLVFKQDFALGDPLMWISVRTEERQVVIEPLPLPPDKITRALHERIDPLNVLWHEVADHVFRPLRCSGTANNDKTAIRSGVLLVSLGACVILTRFRGDREGSRSAA